MTSIDELLAKSRHLIALNVNAWIDPNALQTAQAVIDLLGESQPCTLEPPCTDQPGIVAILDGDGDPLYEFSPGEARAYAAMLLRAADEQELSRV